MIDAHQHLWQIARNGHEWPTPDLDVIHRDFGVDDLAKVAAECGITGTVLVQSQPADADTNWMLGLAAETSLVKGVVGWCDMVAPDAPARIAHLARQPKLKGLRPMLQGLADDAWILREAVKPALKALCDHGLTFDALVFTRHLPSIDTLAKSFPPLAIVVDHGAKPPIASLDSDPRATELWREQISRVAQNANVRCKLSGLVTEMTAGQGFERLTTYADHLLAVFGAERLMWGSDWPVANLNGGYRAWFDWTTAWLSGKETATRTAITGDTARTFYRLS